MLTHDCENAQFLVTDIYHRPTAKFPNYQALMEATQLTREEVGYCIQTGRSVCGLHILVARWLALAVKGDRLPDGHDGFSLKEIADQDGISVQTAAKIKARALEKIRTEIKRLLAA